MSVLKGINDNVNLPNLSVSGNKGHLPPKYLNTLLYKMKDVIINNIQFDEIDHIDDETMTLVGSQFTSLKSFSTTDCQGNYNSYTIENLLTKCQKLDFLTLDIHHQNRSDGDLIRVFSVPNNVFDLTIHGTGNEPAITIEIALKIIVNSPNLCEFHCDNLYYGCDERKEIDAILDVRYAKMLAENQICV
jgi:hypothetical protein